MILTAEEYARGFIDFDAVLPKDCGVSIWTMTADQPEDENQWTGPYSNPQGNKVFSPPKDFIQLRICLNRGEDPTKTPVLQKVRWERNGKTHIWPGPHGFNGPPGPLSLGRDYGVSYRIVFKPKQVTWPQSYIIIQPNLRVRFSKESIRINKVTGFKHATPDSDGKISVEGSIEDIEVKGDFIELLVTVPGDYGDETKEVAKAEVESAIGLLALCFGEQIIGEPVSAEYYFGSATGEEGYTHVDVKHLVDISLGIDSAYLSEKPLSMLHSSLIRASVSMALRWYAAGLQNESLVDAYISYFVGLEALTSGYFASIDPKPVRKEYVQLTDYFTKAKPPIDSRLRGIVMDRISDFPLSIKFLEYWKSRFYHDTIESRQFSSLNRLRSRLIHGSLMSVTLRDVNKVRSLLEKSLARELTIDEIIAARQSGPKLFDFALCYKTMPSKSK